MATLAAAGWPAQAQTVQKCIDAAGHVTLTSAECGDGQRLAERYDAVPEPAAAARQVNAARQAGPSVRAGVRNARPARPRARGKPAPDRCQAARERREQTLRRVGLKRTFDLLRRLDDEVWAACARTGG
ncbi:hypothetical protein [Luteimonas changyuni]|uniref:hypothetical protein n=1 Tax=Luteimonas sp. MJ145 TaxID=3129234 RepID=UPI0031BA10E3